jgi:hypothetical protein
MQRTLNSTIVWLPGPQNPFSLAPSFFDGRPRRLNRRYAAQKSMFPSTLEQPDSEGDHGFCGLPLTG